MKVLVITGGIGSGKSEVCRILAEKGLTIQYNADLRAKQLYVEEPSLLDNIERELGISCTDVQGQFVPALLADKIFQDNEALNKVEELLFPVMLEDFNRTAQKASADDFVVFESATVLEKPFFDGFGDFVVLVDAPFETRLNRAIGRDSSSREKIFARLSNQKLMNSFSEGYTDPRVDYKIENTCSIHELEQQINDFLKLLTINR